MRRLLVGVVGFLGILALGLVAGPRDAVAATGSGDIPYCCAWGTDIADAELTYSISGASGQAEDAIKAAIGAWGSSGTGLSFRFEPNSKLADIKITLKKGGGAIAGQAQRKGDRAGYVTTCSVSLSGQAFGQSALDTLEQVAAHELGHCLGLGHATWDTDLMSPTINAATEITDCHVAGVRAANAWKLIQGSSTPSPTTAGAISCSDGSVVP